MDMYYFIDFYFYSLVYFYYEDRGFDIIAIFIKRIRY